MTAEHILALRRLWQEAFGDCDAFLDAFFATGFSPDRCHFLWENDRPVSALYWFDCTCRKHQFAYLYGVATAKSHQGNGLARQLLTETHEILRRRGYCGTLLVPGTTGLFDFYRKLGYCSVSKVAEFSCTAADLPVGLREVTIEEFARLRNSLLPPDSVLQGKQVLSFLQTQAHFYAGTDFLLTATVDGDTLWIPEFLGNATAAPGILRALGFSKGHFRTIGTDRDFAMLLPLQADCPTPTYFGLALD